MVWWRARKRVARVRWVAASGRVLDLYSSDRVGVLSTEDFTIPTKDNESVTVRTVAPSGSGVRPGGVVSGTRKDLPMRAVTPSAQVESGVFDDARRNLRTAAEVTVRVGRWRSTVAPPTATVSSKKAPCV